MYVKGAPVTSLIYAGCYGLSAQLLASPDKMCHDVPVKTFLMTNLDPWGNPAVKAKHTFKVFLNYLG